MGLLVAPVIAAGMLFAALSLSITQAAGQELTVLSGETLRLVRPSDRFPGSTYILPVTNESHHTATVVDEVPVTGAVRIAQPVGVAAQATVVSHMLGERLEPCIVDPATPNIARCVPSEQRATTGRRRRGNSHKRRCRRS